MKNNITYSKKDEEINSEFYGYFLDIHEDDGWGDNDKYGNFEMLLKIFEMTKSLISESTILDVGSGTGDFSQFLKDRCVKKYTGIDLYELSTKLAQLKYPDQKFLTSDFLTHDFDTTFDFVLCSGTLAATLDSDNYAVMEAFLEKMWRLCNKGIGINFLTKRTENEKDDMLFLYELDKVLLIAKKIAPNSQIEHILNRAGDKKEFLQTHLFIIKTN